jgi:hypothetical protein
MWDQEKNMKLKRGYQGRRAKFKTQKLDRN